MNENTTQIVSKEDVLRLLKELPEAEYYRLRFSPVTGLVGATDLDHTGGTVLDF